jgi:hypothetical protein
MQSKGCTDDGSVVDGTQWVREHMISYGATEEEVGGIRGPFPANRPNDPYLDLILFPRAAGGYAGAVVRFTAHAVVCSAGYWRRNIGRDYPGQLCDHLAGELACPVLFLQGPCGDHRTRHRDVGIEQRDSIARGLAETLLSRLDQVKRFPFDRLEHSTAFVRCAIRDDLPRSADDARAKARQIRTKLKTLPHGAEWLEQRRLLAEKAAFYANAVNVIQGYPYLLPGEAQTKRAKLDVSCVSFANVHLLSFPGELFSTVSAGLEQGAEGTTVVASFADGVTGYLLPEADFREGGYEWTYAPFTPESVSGLRAAAMKLLP